MKGRLADKIQLAKGNITFHNMFTQNATYINISGAYVDSLSRVATRLGNYTGKRVKVMWIASRKMWLYQLEGEAKIYSCEMDMLVPALESKCSEWLQNNCQVFIFK
jgi:hypothetical protein